eukprot:gb/GECG01010533.1/.p1 GENE.gb/GECG01010533.1/~~gb/GECG01010533.1/.p1  ORF type:complete len:169 (+),score=0.13 gb/GECG01010533.1/:1-507(+)
MYSIMKSICLINWILSETDRWRDSLTHDHHCSYKIVQLLPTCTPSFLKMRKLSFIEGLIDAGLHMALIASIAQCIVATPTRDETPELKWKGVCVYIQLSCTALTFIGVDRHMSLSSSNESIQVVLKSTVIQGHTVSQFRSCSRSSICGWAFETLYGLSIDAIANLLSL